jgi:succinyl-diaminopimelate desuccinylase
VAAAAGGLEPDPGAIAPPSGHSPARAWADDHAAEIVDFLRQLVRCERPGPSQQLVERVVRDLGAGVEVLVPGESERRVVVGRVAGRGDGKSLVRAGDPGLWSHPPFAAEVVDGRIVGRGTADAKGPLVGMLFGLACALELSGGLGGDVTVVSVADE